jgi:hypothetical protein
MSAMLRINHQPLLTPDSLAKRTLISTFTLKFKGSSKIAGKLYNQDGFLVMEFDGHKDTVSLESDQITFSTKTVNEILNTAYRKLLEAERSHL